MAQHLENNLIQGTVELLNGEIFYTLKEAQVVIETGVNTTTPNDHTTLSAIDRRHLKWLYRRK
jgi:hypothetical protein